jgi:transcriptional regulator with XRE-family HTH domain
MDDKNISSKTNSPNEWPSTELNPRERMAMNLYDYMQVRGYTQAELADRAGISRTTLASYMTARRYPRPDILARLADALHVSAGVLADNSVGETGSGVDNLSEEAYSIGRMFDQLDERGRKIVRALVEAELDAIREA